MASERFSFLDAMGAFAPGQPLQGVLLLTYSFDGQWFEDMVAPDLFERPVATALLLRDRRALLSESPSVRYHRADAAFSTRVFHPKLALFVGEDRARAIIGRANMTRGGLERNLELGSAFDISPEGGCRSLFKALLAYISGPLRRETDGGSLRRWTTLRLPCAMSSPKPPKNASSRTTSCFTTTNVRYGTSCWRRCRIARFGVPLSSARSTSRTRQLNGPKTRPDKRTTRLLFQKLFSTFNFDSDGDETPVTVCFQGISAKPLRLFPSSKRGRTNSVSGLDWQRRTTHVPCTGSC